MRKTLGSLLFVTILGLTALVAQTKAPPQKLVLAAKNGNVAFDDAAHVKRANNNCKTCHSALFAQDAKAPLGFRPPHKSVEDKKTSCGFCHRAEGTAFETKGNCTNGKCHVKAGV